MGDYVRKKTEHNGASVFLDDSHRYHRLDGPAVSLGDLIEWHYIHGKPYGKEDYWRHPLVVEYNLQRIINDVLREEALKGTKYRSQLDDIWDKMFRPRHKHGYNDEKINAIIKSPEGEKLMDYLEEIYKEITND